MNFQNFNLPFNDGDTTDVRENSDSYQGFKSLKKTVKDLIYQMKQNCNTDQQYLQ